MDDGENFTVTTSYDSYSRPATVAYPTGLTVQTGYTAYGQLAQLKNASTGASYWQANTADARGNVTSDTLGNGVSETRAYDAATGHLTRSSRRAQSRAPSRTSPTSSTRSAICCRAPTASRPSRRASNTTR